jgi:hypothetical protein
VAGDTSDVVVPRLRRRIQELEEENRQLQRAVNIWSESSAEHSREVFHQPDVQQGEDSVREWVQEVSSEASVVEEIDPEEEIEEEFVDSEEERELAEESQDREVVEQFVEAFVAHSGASVSQEVKDRLLESVFTVREDSHSLLCKQCSRLSAVFPFYVRSCIVPGRDESDDLIALSTYSSIPGNEIFASFQREFFGSVED